ncbi:MAG: carboxypeptidase regulatory-like domain-containing protein, partial [Bacteroidales bacterium]
MKRITLLLTALLFSFATLAQSYMMDPETEDKIMQRRQLEQEESLKALKEIYRNINFPKEDTQVFTDYSKGLTYDGVINVLLLSPDGGSWEPLRTALDAFAFINATSFPVASLPSLTVGDLLPYEVVLVFNNNQWLAAGGVNPTVVGDVLAAYIDEGGMIVENSYVMDFGSSLWAMQGAYITGNYSAFTRAVNDIEGSFTLGTVLVPDHPIMTGVSALSGASVLIQDNGVATGATRIADWNNGQVLLAAKDNVVSFNLLPLANGALTFTGDGITLYRNAIVWMMLNLADPDAPAAPTNLTAVAGAEGALSATISWNNPSETFGGEPLTELTSVELSRGGAVIHTVASPVIGGEVTYVDNDVPAAGTYSYSVRGINTAGEGFGASVSIYIGEDVPAAPGNVVLVAQGNDGFITWDAPTEGLNGGYLSGTGLVYTVRRMPANVIVAENITATEYLDDQVPGIGNYFYNVTVANAIGTGGTASSNIALLGAEGVLMYETFDYPAGAIPPGWELTGVAHAWTVNNSSSAGGTAPELRLNWSPAATGMSRLVTYPINVEDHAELRLKYRQFLSNFSTNEGEIAAIDVSFDGGTTWTPAWEYVITANIPVGEYELFIDVPPAKSTMHLGFRFSGNSYNINQWYLDNMILEPVAAADLVALSITGNTTPSVGMETLYTIKVQNAGNETQTDYTVKLMREGGIEIASAAGTAIEFGETLSFQLAWTPTEDDEGPTFLYGYVDFEDDGVPGNNQTANLNVVVQPEDIIVVTIGTSETFPPSRIPFDFFFKNSLSQTLYFADEIGLGGGVLTGVQYTNTFATNLPAKPVKVWVGETDLTDLTGGWVDPASLTLVYDGPIDFPSGVNGIFIPFTMPYVYNGGNLVIYTQRIWEDQYFNSLDRFYGTEFPASNRTRRASADATVYDPTAPPAGNTISWAPNTALFFSTAGLGSLSGTVTDGTNPIEGVQVQVMGTFMKTLTNAAGEYEFPFMLADTYNIEFSKFGYTTLVVENVVVEVEEETVQDATLIAIPQFTVTGIVKGNDDVLQEGAVVTFVGYDTYSA